VRIGFGLNPQRKRPNRPRLPWKRGPSAWKVACESNRILQELSASRRRFYSLRLASRLLGVSTQPLRDWTKRGNVVRHNRRLMYERSELSRFVSWLAKRAQPFDSENYTKRLFPDSNRPHGPFAKLHHSQVSWPKGRRSLFPVEIARLARCHPSLIWKALETVRLRGFRWTPSRWEVRRSDWYNFVVGYR
jgi:hypothetical protein